MVLSSSCEICGKTVRYFPSHRKRFCSRSCKRKGSGYSRLIAETIKEEYPKYGSSIAPKLSLSAEQVINWAYRHKVKLDRRHLLVPLPLSEWQKGYLAGLIDGEGTLGIYYHKRKTGHQFYPRISIANTNIDMMIFLKKIIPSGCIVRQRMKGNRRQLYKFQTSTATVVYPLLLAISDFLVVKRQHAKVLLDFAKRRVVSGHGYKVTEIDFRERKQILKLNEITGHSGVTKLEIADKNRVMFDNKDETRSSVYL